MSWMLAAAGISAVAGFASSRASSKAQSRAAAQELAMSKEESQLANQRAEFNADLEYYYNQVNRQNTQRGLSEYRKFNTVRDFAPGYSNTSSGVVLPDKPTTY